jgi:nucleoside-diphosphate-sugar epimerase
MSYQKVLVTGGVGFIGSNLCNSLISQDVDVVIFDNGFRTGFDDFSLKPNMEIIQGDITKIEDWQKIPNDVDFVYHLGAINGTKFFYEIPDEVLRVNTMGTFNMLNWISASSAKGFFFASSSEVYGYPKKFPTPESEEMSIPDPTNPRFSYSSSKMMGEMLCINFAKKYGIPYRIGRFHNIYGPRMGYEHVIPQFICRLVKNEVFTVQGDGSESRCFCYIDDAINAIKLISESESTKNQIFNIGTCEETTIRSLITSLESVSGEKIGPKFSEFSQAGTNRRVPDIQKLQKIGYSPKFSLCDGLKITYEWYKKNCNV